MLYGWLRFIGNMAAYYHMLFHTAYGSLRPFPTSRQFGKPPNSRTKINLSNRHLQSPRYKRALSFNYLFLFFRHHIRTNSVALFSAYRHAHNPKFLHSLWRRAKTRNYSFETLYSGQFTLSTELITPNYLVILSHRRSTTFSLEAYPL